MNTSLLFARVALTALATGAFVGGLLQVSAEAFGASVGSMVLPGCAALGGSWVSRLVHRSAPSAPGPARLRLWLGTGLATAFLLVGHRLPELLGMVVGWASLPRWSLPTAWVLLGAAAAQGPLHALGRPTLTTAPAVALGLIAGTLLPLPAAALIVGAGVALAPPPVAHEATSRPWLERILILAAVGGTAALGTHIWVVVQPSLDPSPAPLLASMVGVVLALGAVRPRVAWHPWTTWLLLGGAGLAVAAALPHTVGATRLVHTTLSGWLAAGSSPSASALAVGVGLGLGLGALGGAVVGRSSADPLTPLAVVAGLLLGTLAAPASGTASVALGAIVVASTLLLATSRPHQAAALGLGALLAAVVWRGTALPVDALLLSPVAGLRGAEAWEAHLSRAVDQVPGQAPLSGSAIGVVTAAPEDWRASGSSPAVLPFEADLAGRITRPTGRAAEAEVMAGLLAGLLAPRLDRVLLLSDDAGNAMAGLSSAGVSAVDVATPAPHTIQDVARLAPSRRDRWLTPGVRLWPEHPSSVLRRAPTPAAIVDVAHGGWHDSAHAPPTRAHLAAAHRQLGAYGVYVLCLHLGSLREGEPAAVAQAVADTFGRVQVWLPPTGADSMVLVASENPLPLARLESRIPTMLPTLRQLGFPNAAAIGSMAVGDARSVAAWTGSEARLPPRWWLDPALRSRPVLHLASLAPHLAPVERTWDLTDADTGSAALTGRLDARRRFLELLGDAARGDVANALDKARGLASEDGGERALRALVGPHLESARAALAVASREGPSSAAWAEVHRFATTARMIAPTSSEPLVILGVMSLAQGDLSGAQAHFSEAEELADGDLEALTGLARVARLRRDTVSAERYFREAATANPREWVAWHRLGVFLTESNRTDEAETVLERAVGLAGGASPAPSLALARLYLQTERPTPALVHAERSLVVGASAEGYFLRGLAYRDLDQLDNAERDFRQTILTDPTFAAAHGEIGRIRAVRGDPAAAEEAWRAVLRIDPDNANARENLRRLGIEERAEQSTPPG